MSSTLFFVHIPKTAGTALVRSIAAQFNSPGQVLAAYGQDQEIPEILEGFSSGARSMLRFVTAHSPWPVHAPLPQGLRLSFVRHPIERIWSDYWFIRNWPMHPDFRRITAERVSFADFMTKGPWRKNRNTLVRCFSNFDKPEMEGSDLDLALETVRTNFAFVGVCERMDESLADMRRVLGLSLESPRRVNVATSKPKMSAEVRAFAEAENQLDLVLYREIDRMLGQWRPAESAVAADGPGLGTLSRIDLEDQDPGLLCFQIDGIQYNRDTLVIGGWAYEQANRQPVAGVYLRTGDTLVGQNIPIFRRPDLFPGEASPPSGKRFGFLCEASLEAVLSAKSPVYLGFLLADRSRVVEKIIEP